MSMTLGITLQPGEWSILGLQANLQMLQVRGQKAIRLHFGNIADAPLPDDEECYILTQDYNPQYFNLAPFLADHSEAVVFAMPDKDESVPVTVVLKENTVDRLYPPSGPLPYFVVNQFGWQKIKAPDLIDGYWNFAISAGALPAGLTLSHDVLAGQRIGVVSGTPTVVGNFFFTVMATFNDKVLSETYVVEVRPAATSGSGAA